MAWALRNTYRGARRAAVVTAALAVCLAVRAAERLGLLHWPFVTEALSLVPFTFGWQLRGEVYRRETGGCGPGTLIHQGSTFFDRRTVLGRDVWISLKVYVEYALIEDYTLIGPGAVLLAGRRHHRTDRTDVPIKLQGNNPLTPITVGEGAWIGANATVMADVGCHAVVAAGAVVIDPVPAYCVVAGNPARVVGDRRAAQHTRVPIRAVKADL